jgi:hypothetical protein
MSQSVVTGTKVEQPVQSTVKLITNNNPGGGSFLHIHTTLCGIVTAVRRDVLRPSSG